jgi:hypothetical protein
VHGCLLTQTSSRISHWYSQWYRPMLAATNLEAPLPQGAGAQKAWPDTRQPGATVDHARTWRAVGKIMEDDIKRGQPWDGNCCCAAMARLEQLALSEERSHAGDSVWEGIKPGARDLALRVLQQLSRSIAGCRPLQLAAALGTAGRLGLRPAEGVLEALLGAIASRYPGGPLPVSHCFVLPAWPCSRPDCC